MAMQVQIQALLAERVVATGTEGEEVTEVAKPQIFNGTLLKVAGFISVCKLYIKMKLKEELVEEQMQ